MVNLQSKCNKKSPDQGDVSFLSNNSSCFSEVRNLFVGDEFSPPVPKRRRVRCMLYMNPPYLPVVICLLKAIHPELYYMC